MDALWVTYEEIYLLRNQKDLQIYAFEDGRATEPNFVLFMRRKNSGNVYDNIQIFIEPKGKHLRAGDKWKEDFEKGIHSEGIINFHTQSQDFEIWGMPFYTEQFSNEFDNALRNNHQPEVGSTDKGKFVDECGSCKEFQGHQLYVFLYHMFSEVGIPTYILWIESGYIYRRSIIIRMLLLLCQSWTSAS